jgi:hypothetical protein
MVSAISEWFSFNLQWFQVEMKGKLASLFWFSFPDLNPDDSKR